MTNRDGDGQNLDSSPKSTPQQAQENARTARDNQGSVPDRHDTGGGPVGGNTVDGRTGPGETGQAGPPVSTLRVHTDDLSGDGNLGNSSHHDELGTLGADPSDAD
ncbi:hypothetical protein [Deinococcus pimensis]|uniref:hypothetical protein n=1 Tax=Deinococcus pimensis TaxID=309888 RepID=UPI0004830C02|nr:hypothetical protein [Deinococcus pimensis]